MIKRWEQPAMIVGEVDENRRTREGFWLLAASQPTRLRAKRTRATKRDWTDSLLRGSRAIPLHPRRDVPRRRCTSCRARVQPLQ
ncbi:hypothetical protein PUN28_000793 [Cardiocondyla obscurior]|uniref:Uncharacterized protein n=1 Tax=Cardiocondyla obscurior TaxID=286306 RepID=A0AAW2H1F2_9HYME